MNRLSRAVISASLIACGVAWAQTTPPTPPTFPAATTFPNQDKAKVDKHLNIARATAADDLYPFFAQRCILDQAYPILDDLMQEAQYVTPTKVFDDLFFVGHTGVSAWAVKTRAGLVILDALNNASEAEHVLMAGLRKLGFSNSDVKYVVVGHEHRDHFGGAKYLQDTYGVQVVASDVAWNAMATQSGAPQRNITVVDGQRWTLGGKTFRFFVTPGHTNGALSTLFPVTDGRNEHMAAQFGGFGIPRAAETKLAQIQSIRRFGLEARKVDVDVIIGNHQVQDQSIYKFDLIEHRRTSGRNQDPHPFVLKDDDAYWRFMSMQEQCVRVLAARTGQVLTEDSYSDGWPMNRRWNEHRGHD